MYMRVTYLYFLGEKFPTPNFSLPRQKWMQICHKFFSNFFLKKSLKRQIFFINADVLLSKTFPYFSSSFVRIFFWLWLYCSDWIGYQKSDFRVVPRISRKMGWRQIEQGFSSFFAIFDDFSKLNALKVLRNFEKNHQI